MRLPESLVPLVDQGVIEEVIQPLMAGKEAQLYLVRAHGEMRVAKVYKQATERSFKHRAAYTEGRKVRNSRRQRALGKRSRYGREQAEEVWRSAEVDAIYRLRDAGVRVPEPYDFIDGVLVMELIADEHGDVAPRLVDLEFTERGAEEVHQHLLTEVIRMLCAGVVHGDLSDFNVLMGADGPVIIDFPQVVDPAHNRNARMLLIRDVDNLTSFLARFAPRLRGRNYGREMWDLYERNQLNPDTVLTGRARRSKRQANTDLVLDVIAAAQRDAVRRGLIEEIALPDPSEFEEPRNPRASRSRAPRAPRPPEEPAAEAPRGNARRRVVDVPPPPKPKRKRKKRQAPPGQAHRRQTPPSQSAPSPLPPRQSMGDDLDAMLIVEGESAAPKPKRRRRRRRRRGPRKPQGGEAS